MRCIRRNTNSRPADTYAGAAITTSTARVLMQGYPTAAGEAAKRPESTRGQRNDDTQSHHTDALHAEQLRPMALLFDGYGG